MFCDHHFKAGTALAETFPAIHLCELKFRNSGGKVTQTAQLYAGSY
jgi:hypothetical protein